MKASPSITTEDVISTTSPQTKTRHAEPRRSFDHFRWWRLPADGVGLARMEFVVNAVQVHPMALVNFDTAEGRGSQGHRRTDPGYENKGDYFVDTLARGLSRIAAVAYPKPVIVRMSDFKTNEYAELLGGHAFEPKEENPMIGFRGASRYYSDAYRDAFALECKAIKMLREKMGFDNVVVMIPFCRSPEEADKVLEVMADNGLKRGENGLQVYVMARSPPTSSAPRSSPNASTASPSARTT
jgi:pyruvate,water dikinase